MKWIQKRKTQLTSAAFLIGGLMMAPATSAETTASDPKSGQWRVAGQDLSNSRNQPAEHKIGAGNVKALSPQWTVTRSTSPIGPATSSPWRRRAAASSGLTGSPSTTASQAPSLA